MHYLIYYNSTHSKLDGTWFYYCLITYFELALIFLTYPPLLFTGIQMFRFRIFHSNLQICIRAAFFEYLVQLTTRSLQIFLIFQSLENGIAFYIASLVRCTCYFFVSFTLPAFVIERLCACYFLSDYEKKSRFYISGTLLISMVTSGAVLSYLYHQAKSTLYYHIWMLLINMICSGIIVFIEKFNYKRLYESSNLRKNKRGYSLAERFQISENIRVCEFMKTILNVVSIFNLLSTVSAAMDNFDFSETILNLFSTFFNICVLVYGSLVFFLFAWLTPAYRKEWKRLFTRIRILHPISPLPFQDREKPLQLAAIETDKYFEQLNKQWL